MSNVICKIIRYVFFNVAGCFREMFYEISYSLCGWPRIINFWFFFPFLYCFLSFDAFKVHILRISRVLPFIWHILNDFKFYWTNWVHPSSLKYLWDSRNSFEQIKIKVEIPSDGFHIYFIDNWIKLLSKFSYFCFGKERGSGIKKQYSQFTAQFNCFPNWKIYFFIITFITTNYYITIKFN